MAASKTDRALRSPAQVYDECFVPALFEQWGNVVAEAAGVGPGQEVLDVACGTGVLARAAAERVGRKGAVTGLDPNPDMLAVARTRDARIEWVDGYAESLPFTAARFDRVVSQFGFMFFADQPQALREMLRVLRPGGRMAVAVCDALDHSPGYAVFAELLQRLFGHDVAEPFRAPFSAGDARRLTTMCEQAGGGQVKVARRQGQVRFGSISALVETEGACVWTLGGLLDAEQLCRLREEAEWSLQTFVSADGVLDFSMPVLILTAARPDRE